ncbi:uncharacterized protein Dvir_GJ26116, isoform B [Drosophila virilis]|uniref:Uncharacterized protein, isoform B n=1 Tax=Drosophila virilis TaxID=7244 RepID=A0A0Q9WE08_DROVI|nr:uncharacterized protein Dvir_GJ26116, isoform B [Drosophila virilis]
MRNGAAKLTGHVEMMTNPNKFKRNRASFRYVEKGLKNLVKGKHQRAKKKQDVTLIIA